MATGDRIPRHAPEPRQAFDWPVVGAASVGASANRQAGFGSTGLSEEMAAYSVSLESVFGQLRRLLIQIGGLLVLQGGSMRTHLEMGAFWDLTAQALKTLHDEVAALKVPRVFAEHHARVAAAVNSLEHIHKEAFTAGAASSSDIAVVSDLHLRLTNVLGVLRSTELRATGATLIDFRQSCCCQPGDMQCSHR